MHSIKNNIAASDLDLLEDKFTQTGDESKVSKKSPVSTNNIETNKGSVTIFEFCQVVQDPNFPESVTIINEKVTEETVTHPSDSTEETNTANRYKYYREVIKPYIKSKPNSSATSEEYLREAINSAGEDFPDYQPRSHVSTCQRDISSLKALFTDILGKVDAFTSFTNMEKPSSKECIPGCESNDPACPPEACQNEVQEPAPSAPKQKPPCGPPVHVPPKCEKPKNCRPKVKRACSKDSSSNKCNEAPDVVIVTGFDARREFLDTESDDRSETYEYNNFSDTEIVPTNVYIENDSPKTFVEAHNEAMATIKRGMEDFLDKVYKTTQDAVTVITTESMKQLAKIKMTEAANTNIQLSSNENSDSESEETLGLHQNSKDRIANGTSGPAAEVIGTILTTVDSALTILGEKITKSFENFPKLSNFNNKSSPYDRPKAPNEITHKFTPAAETSNSVFSVIKSKIFSMFSDPEPKLEEVPLSTKSSNVSSVKEEESDEDLIDRIIK